MKTNFTTRAIGLPTARNSAVRLLSRIDIHESDVLLDRISGTAILWFHQKNGKDVEIRCSSQRTPSSNLAAVIIWLKSRVINVERGIETIDNAFSGYLKLTGSTDIRYASGNGIFNQEERLALKTLDLNENATLSEIEDKYKLLIKTWHPDRAIDIEHKKAMDDKTSEINSAYSLLKKNKLFGD